MLELAVLDTHTLPAGQLVEELSALHTALPRDSHVELFAEEPGRERLALLVWTLECDRRIASAVVTEQLTAHFGTAAVREIVWLAFEPILEVGSSRLTSPVANIIMREIEPAEVKTFLTPLQAQMKEVAARPGCRGAVLGQLDSSPDKLLGITRWAAMGSLQRYLKWPGAHKFKPVVEPITLDTPLRFLGVRVESNT